MRVPGVLCVAVDRQVRRDRLGEFLAEIAWDDVVPDDGPALGRLSRPRHDAHEGRLAESVVADERHLVAARDVELESVEHLLHAVVAEAKVLAAEHLDSARRRLGEAQPAGLRIALREDDPLLVDLVDELLAALGLSGLRRLRAEAVHEPLKLLAVVVLVLLRGLEMLVADLALFHVPVQVPLVPRHGPRVHLHRDACERPQEVAVVRNQHERAVVRLEVLLEPVHRRKVEVVGWFVEKKEVRLRREHTGQLRAHAPASREGLERLRELFRREAEASERHLDARLDVVAAEVLELGLELAVALHLDRVGEVGLQLGHLGLHLGESGNPPEGILEKRLVRRVRLGVLPREAYARAPLDYQLAGVSPQLAEDDLEEGGLP